MSSTRKIRCGQVYNTSTVQMMSSLPYIGSPWTHIELGAANYGTDLTADSSNPCQKLGKHQHKLLFDTMDNLIKQKGKKGIIYINDLEKRNVSYTIYKIKKHLMRHHADNEIILVPLVGDFFKISLPPADSIHLKNPED